MTADRSTHNRQSIRHPQYDYASAGAYFVTICTQGRECLLDDPVVMVIIHEVWQALPSWFPTIALDEFEVMSNHVHLLVWLQSSNSIGASRAGASPAPTTGETVGANRAGASPAPTTGDTV